VPTCFFNSGVSEKEQGEYERMLRVVVKPETVQFALSSLAMAPQPAVAVQSRFCLDPAYQGNRPFYIAKTGRTSLRVRSAHAVTLLAKVVPMLPQQHVQTQYVDGIGVSRSEDEGRFTKSAVTKVMENKVYADAGTGLTLGRLGKYYPRAGSTIARPFTTEEAEIALQNCGLVAPTNLRKITLEEVRMNHKADNGLPVLGNLDTPGAAGMVLGLAKSVLDALAHPQARGLEGVRKWYDNAIEQTPWLVAFLGKAKADYYAPSKIRGQEMRFYNALPRQILAVLQTVTQPFEQSARNALTLREDMYDGFRTAQGVSLVRGGAENLVAALQQQLEERGFGALHVGDDSWVVARVQERVVMFALDCSSFDLTQHNETTDTVHIAIRDQLMKLDPQVGALWYWLMRYRLVVVSGGVTRLWVHAGPSGMALQSKVNDMLMDILLQRLERVHQRSEETFGDVEKLAEEISRLGKECGFTIKLEDYRIHGPDLKTIAECLVERWFKFIGYYFYAEVDLNLDEEGLGEVSLLPLSRKSPPRVHVVCDLPRTLAQVPYPSQKWLRSKDELEKVEAVRLGSIALGLGRPPMVAVRPTRGPMEFVRLHGNPVKGTVTGAIRVFQREAMKLLERALLKYGDWDDERVRWAIQEHPNVGPVSQASLRGLLNAIQRPDLLWEREAEMSSVSEFLSRDEAIEWPARVIKLPVIPAPKQHGWTRYNDGRPPPTRPPWGPDKQPRVAEDDFRPFERARKGRAFKGGPSGFEEEEWRDEDSGEESWDEYP